LECTLNIKVVVARHLKWEARFGSNLIYFIFIKCLPQVWLSLQVGFRDQHELW